MIYSELRKIPSLIHIYISMKPEIKHKEYELKPSKSCFTWVLRLAIRKEFEYSNDLTANERQSLRHSMDKSVNDRVQINTLEQK